MPSKNLNNNKNTEKDFEDEHNPFAHSQDKKYAFRDLISEAKESPQNLEELVAQEIAYGISQESVAIEEGAILDEVLDIDIGT